MYTYKCTTFIYSFFGWEIFIFDPGMVVGFYFFMVGVVENLFYIFIYISVIYIFLWHLYLGGNWGLRILLYEQIFFVCWTVSIKLLLKLNGKTEKKNKKKENPTKTFIPAKDIKESNLFHSLVGFFFVLLFKGFMFCFYVYLL